MLMIAILTGSMILHVTVMHRSLDYSQILESTVLIEIDGQHTGSGFMVEVSDNEVLVITARHVVDRKGSYSVVFADGSKRSVQGIRMAEASDCAVLLVYKTGLRPLKLTTKVRIGQPIVVIGNPLERRYFNYITHGIVSKLDVLEDWLSCNSLIMIDAAVNPGNSGGPVFDLRGRVIGIVIARYTYNCGMNFLTPSIDILTLLEEWNDEGANWDEKLEEAGEEFADEYEASVGAS